MSAFGNRTSRIFLPPDSRIPVAGWRAPALARSNRVVECRLCRNFMISVEHHREWRAQMCVQCLEIAACECGYRGVIFRRELWQPELWPPTQFTGRQAEVIKERGNIGVAFVDLVPKGWLLAAFKIAGHERRLPAPRGARHPDNGFPGGIQHGEEAIPRQDAREAWTRRLGERNGFCAHACRVPHRLQAGVTRCSCICGPLRAFRSHHTLRLIGYGRPDGLHFPGLTPDSQERSECICLCISKKPA